MHDCGRRKVANGRAHGTRIGDVDVYRDGASVELVLHVAADEAGRTGD